MIRSKELLAAGCHSLIELKSIGEDSVLTVAIRKIIRVTFLIKISDNRCLPILVFHSPQDFFEVGRGSITEV
jgi:hypothetical protein